MHSHLFALGLLSRPFTDVRAVLSFVQSSSLHLATLSCSDASIRFAVLVAVFCSDVREIVKFVFFCGVLMFCQYNSALRNPRPGFSILYHLTSWWEQSLH